LSAFSIQQSAFSNQHSAFSIQQSAFSIQQSAFSPSCWWQPLVFSKAKLPQVYAGLCKIKNQELAENEREIRK